MWARLKGLVETNCPRLWLYLRHSRNAARYGRWEREGCPMPPPHVVKQQLVLAYADRYHLTTLVETGTYRCEMLFAMRRAFDRIYSIEFAGGFATAAQNAFKRYPHISVLRGDSGEVLQQLAPTLPGPCLFWLDAHEIPGVVTDSPEPTPVTRELGAILARSQSQDVVLIDDARAFSGRDGWPTVAQIREQVLSARPGWSFELRDDVMRFSPIGFT